MRFTPVSERIATIRIAGKSFNLTAIQVHAPTSDCCDEIIEEFYGDLEKVIKVISRKIFWWCKEIGMQRLGTMFMMDGKELLEGLV